MKHHPYNDGFGKWPVILMGLLVLAILLYAYQVQAQSQGATARYQMIRHDNRGYFWTWSAGLPYTPLGLLCWDDAANNFCEPSLNFNRTVFIYEIIDWQAGTRGLMYQENKRNGRCFTWWMHPHYGTDGNPHVEIAEWNVCP